MLRFLRGRVGERKLRLFACACCRRIGQRWGNLAAKAAAVVERYADGDVRAKERFERYPAADDLGLPGFRITADAVADALAYVPYAARRAVADAQDGNPAGCRAAPAGE